MKAQAAEPYPGYASCTRCWIFWKQSRRRRRAYGLADLARSVELPKATVYRILTTLEGRGYLDRRENGSYRMARKMFDLQRPVPIEQILSQVAHPLMEQLGQ